MKLIKEQVAFASMDTISQYLSIKYDLIEEAILYFASPLTVGNKDTVTDCLSHIRLEMGKILVDLGGKYFGYGGIWMQSNKVLYLGDMHQLAFLIENTINLSKDTWCLGYIAMIDW